MPHLTRVGKGGKKNNEKEVFWVCVRGLSAVFGALITHNPPSPLTSPFNCIRTSCSTPDSCCLASPSSSKASPTTVVDGSWAFCLFFFFIFSIYFTSSFPIDIAFQQFFLPRYDVHILNRSWLLCLLARPLSALKGNERKLKNRLVWILSTYLISRRWGLY